MWDPATPAGWVSGRTFFASQAVPGTRYPSASPWSWVWSTKGSSGCCCVVHFQALLPHNPNLSYQTSSPWNSSTSSGCSALEAWPPSARLIFLAPTSAKPSQTPNSEDRGCVYQLPGRPGQRDDDVTVMWRKQEWYMLCVQCCLFFPLDMSKHAQAPTKRDYTSKRPQTVWWIGYQCRRYKRQYLRIQ